MSLRINSNVEAFSAHKNLISSSDKLTKSLEKLSSGSRINRGGDDAAGLVISEKLRAQERGYAQAQRNANDGISFIQTAEGALNEVHSMLQRVRELAVQYKNGTLGTSDQAAIASEVAQLTAEIERIGTSTKFNGINLLNGTSTVSFQVGTGDGEQIGVALISLGSTVGALDLTSTQSISGIDAGIANVSSTRARFGAVQNRLEYATNSLATAQENAVAAGSRIRDVDMAAEMVNYTKLQILQQAGTAMLAQANSAPQNVLSLLR